MFCIKKLDDKLLVDDYDVLCYLGYYGYWLNGEVVINEGLLYSKMFFQVNLVGEGNLILMFLNILIFCMDFIGGLVLVFGLSCIVQFDDVLNDCFQKL